MGELGALFLRAMFAENMPLTYFLGLCTFLALSRRTDTAFGLGVAGRHRESATVPAPGLGVPTQLTQKGGMGAVRKRRQASDAFGPTHAFQVCIGVGVASLPACCHRPQPEFLG